MIILSITVLFTALLVSSNHTCDCATLIFIVCTNFNCYDQHLQWVSKFYLNNIALESIFFHTCRLKICVFILDLFLASASISVCMDVIYKPTCISVESYILWEASNTCWKLYSNQVIKHINTNLFVSFL